MTQKRTLKEILHNPIKWGATAIIIGSTVAGALANNRFENQKREAYKNMVKIDSQIASLKTPQPITLEEIVEKSERIEPEENRFKIENYSQKEEEIMTEAIYAEGREMWQTPEYLRDIGITIITRALERGLTIEETIGQKSQYSYRNKGSKSEVKKENAKEISQKNIIEKRAYETVEKVVRNLLKNGFDKSEILSHYYVNTARTPKFAKENPILKEYNHKGKTTRFYYITPTEARKRGGVFSSKI